MISSGGGEDGAEKSGVVEAPNVIIGHVFVLCPVVQMCRDKIIHAHVYNINRFVSICSKDSTTVSILFLSKVSFVTYCTNFVPRSIFFFLRCFYTSTLSQCHKC